MSQEKQFINESIKRLAIEKFLAGQFSKAGYSHCEIQRTPLALRIMIYAHKPGLIIGKDGRNIDATIQALKEKFNLENPQLDVQDVPDPDLDPHIVGKQIATAIERGLNYKRVVNLTVQRVMDAGAVGVAIRIGGKLGGAMSRIEKFSAGYLKYAGDPADTEVRKAYSRAQVKLGTIGIQVRILTVQPKEITLFKKISELKSEEQVKESGDT